LHSCQFHKRFLVLFLRWMMNELHESAYMTEFFIVGWIIPLNFLVSSQNFNFGASLVHIECILLCKGSWSHWLGYSWSRTWFRQTLPALPMVFESEVCIEIACVMILCSVISQRVLFRTAISLNKDWDIFMLISIRSGTMLSECWVMLCSC